VERDVQGPDGNMDPFELPDVLRDAARQRDPAGEHPDEREIV
jgi:hypothetical protein